jgi:PAS domain S-box-containing protein
MHFKCTPVNCSEEYFQSLVTVTDQLVWTTDAHGHITPDQPNTPWKEFTGQTEEEMKEGGWLDALHPDDRERVARVWQQAVSNLTVYDVEYRLRRHDGQYRYFSVRGIPVMNKRGNVTEWIGACMDITERKQKEVELQWKTAFLEAQVHHSLDGILVVDTQANKLLQNQRMVDLWKIPISIAEDPNDESELQFVINQVRHPQQFIEKVRHLYAHPDETSRDEIDLKDGRIFDRYSSPVFDKEGKYYGRIWTFRDITNRKRAEEALLASRHELGEAQRLAKIGSWVWEPKQDIVTWSEQLFQIFGCDSTLPAPSFRQQQSFFTPESWERLRAAAEKCVQTGEPYQLDLEAVRADGQRVWTIARGEAQRDAVGRITKLRGTVQDITNRKRAEQALKEAYDNMEQRVQERTTELKIANEQLQKTNRFLHILSACNQLVVRARNEQELLREVCNIIVGPGGYPSCWVGFAEEDPGKTVRPVAHAGFKPGYLDALKISWGDNNLGQGGAGKAIRSGKPSIITDIQTSPDFVPWRKIAAEHGYASCIGLPLKGTGRVFGALLIYARTPDAFHEREVNALMELADDLAYGIISLRAQSERERAKEHLLQLVDFQSAILDNTIYMVATTDLNGVVTSFNPAAERALGYSSEECIGKLKVNLFHDQTEMAERAKIFSQELGVPIEPGFEVFAARARRDLANEYEWTFIRKDGSRFPVLLSVTALRDSRRNIIGFMGIANDITARKQVEDALRTSRQELNEAQRIAKVGSWLWDPLRDKVTWSDELYHIADRDPSLPAPTYHELQRHYSPENWNRLNTAVQRALETGTPYELDLELLRENGRHAWIIARGEAQHDASGRIVKLRGTAQDITERKLAEEALQRSEQKFQTIFRGSPVALSVSELETGRFVEINQAMLRLMHGTSFDQMVGRTSVEIGMLTPGERQKMLDAVLHTGHVDRLEIAVRRLDGEPFTAEASMSRYEMDGKNYILANIVDVTENKLAREEIQRLNIELEKRVTERTAELATANKELETFNYSVSHDLRSPLRTVDGFSRLLMEDYASQLSAEAQSYLGHIVTATSRMDQLIRGLLNLSHITRTQIRPRPVSLSAIAETIASELHESEPQRSVEFVIAPNLIAQGDADLLRSVMQNLLSNAWKYTSKHPRARIEFGAGQIGGETVFYVRDDGAGFAPENAGKLFNPFQRLHGTEEFPGTGIGLTIVQRIIQRHGGRIWAEGEEEKGATFYFTLPGRK